MSIKLILNSYYRSGSTYFYNAIRSNNPNLLSYYEPLSADLPKMIDSTLNKFDLHSDYGYSNVMDFYHLLPPNIISKLYRNLPMMSEGNFSDSNIVGYLDIFDSIEDNVFLQTNNLHFHLDVVLEAFDVGVIHLVRSPVDVLSSIHNVPLNRNSHWKQGAKLLFSKFGYFHPFNLGIEYDYVQNHFNSIDGVNYDWKKKYHMLQVVNRFVTVWVESNFQAMQSILDSSTSSIIFFDHFFGGNKQGFSILEKQLHNYGIGLLELPPISKKVNSINYADVEFINNKVDELGLRKKFNFIVAVAKEHNSIIGDIF